MEATKNSVSSMYPTIFDNDDYTSVVNQGHYERLDSYIHDAKNKGAEVIEINPANESKADKSFNKMLPTIILKATDEMLVMQEEIFGPILPIITFEKNSLLLPELAILGWLHFSKAFDQALEEDAHPSEYEIHYIVNGEVNWWVEESNYILRAGTMLIIRPGERHGSRTGALEPCEHFWLRIPLNEKSPLPGLDLKETRKIKFALDSFQIRAFPVSHKIGVHFQDLLEEHRAPKEHSRLVCRALLHHLLVSVIRDYTAEGGNLGQSNISEGIQNCIKEITQNLDSPPTIEQLAKSMSISETAFRKIFRQQVGYSPFARPSNY